ncbi:tRNA glutamyl-Q(34) synthetase GluQRS [Alkalilimnicola ehrlichii]|uniref:Glutamyl-Q tRNA(Asp) synthetase n=1 Tax=Alkalilimnicola ehrlichii TaxID=351052 RepID=A0A3E0WVB6_9GAMM|nr:tRNA glutamyl-Q(34) synthetase GluQRS [Alkalilimnicola ehrlichii]RFA27736.1 tRNA glutamyl-Q(34) synthetase GluQRS [Alkalilimnicola ehrlichii]RFA36930.1 tRNA glutamyl-Q(34) synthetase GluQRS [Alkalilimnicola ehrlichii]
MQAPEYRGRFAPSPTGPLHFGSLIAATGSYLQARSQNGRWLLRIEDIDPPREVPGAADDILRTLTAFGFEWDAKEVYQSERHEAYQAALDRLSEHGLAYPCACTRKQIQAVARLGPAGAIYPGTCREGLNGRQARAWRVRTEGEQVAFSDGLQGEVYWNLDDMIGDFVVRRADGYYAYHLASVVDDAAAGITEVVRGQDLLACTPPQIHLQRLLDAPTPSYLHLPIAVNRAGQKLSKQTFATALDHSRANELLAAALQFLGQPVPKELTAAPLPEIWDWAIAAWDIASLPRREALPTPSLMS